MDQSGSLLSSAEQPGLDAVLCTPRLSLMNVRWSFSMLKIFRVRSSVHISEKDRRTGSTMESKCFLKVYMNLHVNLHFTFKSYASLKFPKPDILYLFRFL